MPRLRTSREADRRRTGSPGLYGSETRRKRRKIRRVGTGLYAGVFGGKCRRLDAARAGRTKNLPGKGPVLAIAAIVVLVAIIAVLVVLLIKSRKAPETATEEPVAEQGVTEEETPEEIPEEGAETPEEEAIEEETMEEEADPFVPSVSYIKEADAFDDALLDQVIVSCGDSTLTNRKLAYYYCRNFIPSSICIAPILPSLWIPLPGWTPRPIPRRSPGISSLWRRR